MGIPAAVSQKPAKGEMANAVVAGQFTGTGQSPSFMALGPFNACLWGAGGPNGNWTATVRLERSFDGGASWLVCGVGQAGAQAVYNTPNQDVSLVFGEPEQGVLYRWNCALYTSGTINYRLSTTGSAGLSAGVAAQI